MSSITPRGIPIELGGKERHILFTLNMIDQIEEKYEKSLQEVMEEVTKEESRHLLRDLMTDLVNDEIKRDNKAGEKEPQNNLTEEDMGEMIGLDNYSKVLYTVMKAYGISLPEADEDENPNEMSGQAKG